MKILVKVFPIISTLAMLVLTVLHSTRVFQFDSGEFVSTLAIMSLAMKDISSHIFNQLGENNEQNKSAKT